MVEEREERGVSKKEVEKVGQERERGGGGGEREKIGPDWLEFGQSWTQMTTPCARLLKSVNECR